MRKTFWIIAILIGWNPSDTMAQLSSGMKLQTGDLLFQDLDCGPLCDAIEQVTKSYQGNHFSHIGMVYVRQDSIYIIEAIGNEVQLTQLSKFMSRTSNKVLVGRVKENYRSLVNEAVNFSVAKLKTPYDDTFLYANGKYYCSELIYDAFKEANHGKDFFRLEPMTFKQPGKNEYFPVWVEYYAKLGIPIPEGKPGINPGGISTAGLLDFLNE
ncbi:hypothetical protein DYBT9275_05777 [Dyadobacter sp. CECT 9275]|uniref:Permuted papain-like amidase YaeF/Yiix C92 family enzyme n=1 Tax=Dyadobacter helix TaxID=2822344 RepID=A0A916JI32_9BACT|nr:YiiX/YebB-like N1pC/P60 family cysteine hydrolase [Dyadobacter sp. CECT 9275]CAG5017465.1 hypothetical protein DYBT9275_05777 [Dyadobacter sp. CECT 9275]